MVSLAKEIYLVPHEGKFLLHEPLHGGTSLLNAAMVTEIQQTLFSGRRNHISATAANIVESLSQNKASEPPIPKGPFAPNHVSLLPTTDCNMRCLYCAPGAGDGNIGYMSTDICDIALNYQTSIVKQHHMDTFMVYLFGGEPFLAWELIQHCDKTGRTLADSLGVPYHCACTTNAYMSPKRATWVGRHLSFVLVSMDGPADLHNFYRPNISGQGTHDVVVRNLKIFEEQGLTYALRCSVDDNIVHRVPEIVEYFCTEFNPQKINLEPLIEHGRCLETGLKSPNPIDFVNAIIAAGKVARRHGVELKLTTAQTDWHNPTVPSRKTTTYSHRTV